MNMVPLSSLFLAHRAGFWGADPGTADVTARVIRNGDVLSSGDIRWTELPLRGFREAEAVKARVARDDLIITSSASCGYVAHVADEPRDATCASNFVRLLRVATARVLPRYLFHFMNREEFRASLAPFIRGTAMKNLAVTEAFDHTLIPLPAMDEQRRIAEVLDRAAELSAKRRSALSQLETLAQAVFVDLFGDQVADSKSWPRARLASLCRTEDDVKCGPFGTQLAKSEYTSEGVPLWGIRHVNARFELPTHEHLDSETARRLSQYSIEPRDIVMTRKGTIGNCAVYPGHFPPGIMHSDLLRVRVSSEHCDPLFLSHQLHHSSDVARQLAQISGGAVMPGINVTKLKSLQVLVAPLNLQREFARRVDAVDRLRASHRASLAKLDALFASLQHRAFRGEL
jgi:type I restriction enzyme, S subunit